VDITSAAIATIVSAATSASVTLLIAKSNTKKSLDDQLDGLLKISIQYPYLESDSYTSTWKSNHDGDEKHERYEHYCTLLFNYLSRVCSHHKHNKKKIEDYVAIKTWIRCHKLYWKDPTDPYGTRDEYDPKFVAIVNSYI